MSSLRLHLMNCPLHNVEMPSTKTIYGLRFACERPDCTMVCWEGSTSTPADLETRTLRKHCHALFDPLWRNRPKRFKSRTAAYVWLRRVMDVPADAAHIGMFDAAQCKRLIDFIHNTFPKVME